MKTILIVSLHNSNWGAERSTCSIAAYLQSLGYRVILIIPSDGKIMEIIKKNNLTCEIHYFRGWTNNKRTDYIRAVASTTINVIQALSLVAKFHLQNKKPDLIYTNTLAHGFGILLAKFFRVSHVQHIRENIDSFGMKFDWGYLKTIEIIDKNSKKIVSTCTAVKDRYAKDFTATKMMVVYNGIPIQPYKKPQIMDSLFTMVYAGRLYMDKRPQDLIQSLREIVESGINNIRLDIYGEGPMENELKEYSIQNDLSQYVVFKGFQHNIDFSKYYVGFMPSEFEAFARTTLEYMMNGLAVIGTNTGGTKEQIVHDQTGFLYTPGNLDEIASNVKCLYNDRQKCIEFGKEGYKRVISHFSQEEYVKNLGKIITENI